MVRFALSREIQRAFGLVEEDFELAVRVTKDFYNKNKEFVQNLVKEWGKPALVEMWNEKIFYFILKYEFNFIDSLNKAATLTTDQVDVENSERYGITYIDKKGEKKTPKAILHLSPSGAIERVMYAILEQQLMKQQKGGIAQFPLWLAPTQVRIVPVTETHIEPAKKIVEELRSQHIRADLDDREQTLGKKIRSAEKEWCPYIVVIGDEEVKSNRLSIRIRGQKEQKNFTTEVLAKKVLEQTKDKPFQQLPLPMKLTQRAIFHG